MSSLLPFLIVGAVSGSLYGLAAVGLVLTFKTSGIFNLAHGSIAAVSAYTFYALNVDHGVAWPIVLLICVCVEAPIVGLAMELLARGLSQGATAQKVVATVGLQVGLTSFLLARFGSAARNFPQFLSSRPLHLGSAIVTVGEIISVVIAVVAVAGLTLFFRMTSLGAQMRAVVDDSSLLQLCGTSSQRVRRTSWIIGCVFAALSGALLAPTIGLDATLLTELVIQAFGAAALGWFSNLPLTYAGGLVVGILAAVTTRYAGSSAILNGLAPSMPFIVLFVVLLAVPRGRLVEIGAGRSLPPRISRLSPAQRAAVAVVALILLALVPQLVGVKLSVYTEALTFVMMFQSLNLLVNTSGQVSLCQAGFVAVGAAVFPHLIHGAGLPWLVALIVAGLIAVPVGAIVAIPAIRLSGLFLALATLGFGLLLSQLVYPLHVMFGLSGSIAVPRPAGFASDTAMYYLVLAFVVVTCGLIAVINRTRIGRLLRAMADSPLSLATLGLSVDITKVAVFCLAAFIAAVAGGLYGATINQVSGIPFQALTSLTWLAVLGLSGRGRQSAAFIAAALLVVLPAYVSNDTVTNYLPVGFGAGAVIAALYQATRRAGGASTNTATHRRSRLLARRDSRGALTARHRVLVRAAGSPVQTEAAR